MPIFPNSKSRFSLIAAPFTPFDENGALQLATIEKQAAHLSSNGVIGAFICGTTGEGVSMSSDERRDVAARWCKVTGDQMPIIVHVGHTNLQEARALAAHAQSIGAVGIAATAPFYFKTNDALQTARWCAQIAEAAPDVPFFYYHIPLLTGVNFPVAPFLSIARETIPNFGGVKFTHGDLFDFGRCLDEGQDLELFFGCDEILLAGLAVGARGAVGSAYNLAAPLYRRLITDFEAGDIAGAQAAQKQAREIISVLVAHGGIPAMKSAMKILGVDCGPSRAPLAALDNQQEHKLRAELERVGFFAA